MGEQIDANFTLAPRSLNGAVVQNYVDSATAANDFAKIDPSTFANLNLAAVDNTTAGGPYYLTARISNVAMPVVTCATAPCFQSGSADVSVPFTLSRNALPDGAYGMVEVGIALLDADSAPVDAIGTAGTGTCNNTTVAACYDLDVDATVGNDHALLATTVFRYGRSKISNAHGSELLPLVQPMAAEYWNSTAYTTSVDDSISLIAVTLGNYQRNLTAGMTTATVSAIVNGLGRIGLSRPGTGNNGSVDVTVSAPSYLPSNTARATFGVYKGSNEFIYQRENY
jgi:MSHA biogenesis protein MshQ